MPDFPCLILLLTVLRTVASLSLDIGIKTGLNVSFCTGQAWQDLMTLKGDVTNEYGFDIIDFRSSFYLWCDLTKHLSVEFETSLSGVAWRISGVTSGDSDYWAQYYHNRLDLSLLAAGTWYPGKLRMFAAIGPVYSLVRWPVDVMEFVDNTSTLHPPIEANSHFGFAVATGFEYRWEYIRLGLEMRYTLEIPGWMNLEYYGETFLNTFTLVLRFGLNILDSERRDN